MYIDCVKSSTYVPTSNTKPLLVGKGKGGTCKFLNLLTAKRREVYNFKDLTTLYMR